MNLTESRIAMQNKLAVETDEGAKGVIARLRSCGCKNHLPRADVLMEMDGDTEYWPLDGLKLHADNDNATLAMLGLM